MEQSLRPGHHVTRYNLDSRLVLDTLSASQNEIDPSTMRGNRVLCPLTAATGFCDATAVDCLAASSTQADIRIHLRFGSLYINFIRLGLVP